MIETAQDPREFAVPSEDGLDDLFYDLGRSCSTAKDEMREAWSAVQRILADTPGGPALLKRLTTAAMFHQKDMLRSAYWRGYYVGHREAGPARPPVPECDWNDRIPPGC